MIVALYALDLVTSTRLTVVWWTLIARVASAVRWPHAQCTDGLEWVQRNRSKVIGHSCAPMPAQMACCTEHLKARFASTLIGGTVMVPPDGLLSRGGHRGVYLVKSGS